VPPALPGSKRLSPGTIVPEPVAPLADGAADSDALADALGAVLALALAEALGAAVADGAALVGAVVGAVVGAALDGAAVGAVVGAAVGDGVAAVPLQAASTIDMTPSIGSRDARARRVAINASSSKARLRSPLRRNDELPVETAGQASTFPRGRSAAVLQLGAVNYRETGLQSRACAP